MFTSSRARWEPNLTRAPPLLVTVPCLLLDLVWLQQDSGASTPLRQGIQAYVQHLPGYAESDQRRLRLQHEVTLLLLRGGVEPLTAAEIEDLGLEDGDESVAD